MKMSKMTGDLGGSMIREMFNEALKIEDTIKFTVGEPDFITPKPIIEAACRAWRRGLTHYTPNMGIPELRQAISIFHKDEIKSDPQTQVFVSCGATEALQMALFTLVDPGDEVLLVVPAWPNYFGQVRMCGATAKLVPAYEKNNFVPDPDDIKKAISSKTKAIVLNSPSNPTGAVIDRGTYNRIIEILTNHDIFIIADEVYSRLIYEGIDYDSISDYKSVMDKAVYINSFSKMFAMTGWRLGYAISTPDIIKNMTKLHENGASCLPAPSQLAAAAALTHHVGEIESMRRIFEKRRNVLCAKINEINGMSCHIPEGAFYVFANIKQLGIPSKEFCMELLRETGVVIVPGIGFGSEGEGYVRFTYATSEENIIEGLARVKTFVEALQ